MPRFIDAGPSVSVENLIEKLRECKQGRYSIFCYDCRYRTFAYCQDLLQREAADAIEKLLSIIPTFDNITEILSRYFNIGDSDTYELTRVKEAFALGTMKLDDFSEWDEENVADLASYIIEKLLAPKEDTE